MFQKGAFMEKRYFDKNEDFFEIISSVLKSGDLEIYKISTGWTNAVYKAFSDGKYYIFRFPRNNYWSDVIEKEAKFNKFLTTKTQIPTSKMNLIYDKGRPFTYHEMIEGETFQDVYDELTIFDKEKIAGQLAKFLTEFQDIKISDVDMEIDTTSNFLERLSKIEKNEYDLSMHKFLIDKENETEQVLSHGDLNSRNILIDKNKNVVAILDFAFISKSSRLTDLARLVGRLPEDFKDLMIKEYNNISSFQLDKDDINKIVDVYKYVDNKYIEFMRNYYPEISITD